MALIIHESDCEPLYVSLNKYTNNPVAQSCLPVYMGNNSGFSNVLIYYTLILV